MHARGYLESREEIAQHLHKRLYVTMPAAVLTPVTTPQFRCSLGAIAATTLTYADKLGFNFEMDRNTKNNYLLVHEDGSVPWSQPEVGRIFTNFWRAYAYLATTHR